jgi:hypothetical protein
LCSSLGHHDGHYQHSVGDHEGHWQDHGEPGGDDVDFDDRGGDDPLFDPPQHHHWDEDQPLHDYDASHKHHHHHDNNMEGMPLISGDDEGSYGELGPPVLPDTLIEIERLRREEHHNHHHHDARPSHGDHHHHHNPMRPQTHIAYHHVEAACAADVESLCPVEQPSLFQPLDDPFLEWLLMPTAMDPPSGFMMQAPEFDNIGPLIDQMMDSALDMPISFSLIIVEDMDEPMTPPAPEQVVDAFVSKMAQEQPEEIPQLAQRLVEHGQQVLEQDDVTEERRHLARRLTQVNPDQIYHGVHLPFGCPRNRCLIAASQEGRVSQSCMAVMNQLQQVNEFEIQLEQQQAVFLGMMWIYVLLLVMLLVLMGRRYAQNKANRHLKFRILKAVYANPSIKAQLEQDLDESIGNVPPVSAHVLRLMSAGGMALRRQMECARRVQLVFFFFLVNLIIFSPFWVLPICIVVSAIRVALLCCAPSPVRECTCCCCGVSTEDVTNGNVTEAQACCNCCVGTGVCSPACAACCGGDGCCCGGEDCSCCNAAAPKTSGDYDLMLHSEPCCSFTKPAGNGGIDLIVHSEPCRGFTKPKTANGIDLIVHSEPCRGFTKPKTAGCCCCCGASPEQVATGTLTEAQACCCCCSGTGCCSGASCSCCNAAPKGRGQKHVFQAKEGIYQGVPIQVV